MAGKQRCVWHWLEGQPIDVQIEWAGRRRAALPEGVEERARVPASEWPDGERWCAGCQGFVPLFYCNGSRCKAHASKAAHGSRVKSLYGISEEDYDALLKLQGGRCFICQKRPQGQRLAVDHDHKTGAVRGLLCANNEWGCNHAVIANLEGARDGGLPAARRAVLYLVKTPLERLRSGEGLSWAQFIAQEHARLSQGAEEEPVRVSGHPPPF